MDEKIKRWTKKTQLIMTSEINDYPIPSQERRKGIVSSIIFYDLWCKEAATDCKVARIDTSAWGFTCHFQPSLIQAHGAVLRRIDLLSNNAEMSRAEADLGSTTCLVLVRLPISTRIQQGM